MEMTGSQLIPASIENVWAGINDVQILQRCLPNCESVTREAEFVLQAKMAIKIGPVSAKFSGRVELTDVLAPQSCKMNFQGQGGSAGFARGEAIVKLKSGEAGTLLEYEARANVGGKLAQIGSRLVDATASKIADQFFANFKKVFEESASVHVAETEPVLASQPAGGDLSAAEHVRNARPSPSTPAASQVRTNGSSNINADAPFSLVSPRVRWARNAAWFFGGAVLGGIALRVLG